MEKIILVSAGEEIKRPLAREKNKQKLMSTWQLNERKKNECHMKPKNQQENEEYNEDKKQQIALKEKKLKKIRSLFKGVKITLYLFKGVRKKD